MNNPGTGIFGIHHVTAITSNAQRNVDFYTKNLGLRFVKLTVNQDDPTAYHLYYGDELGRPGTIITFFNWPDLPRGRRGTSEVIATSFLIPENSINYWIDRFKSQQIEFRGPNRRFYDEQVITFNDPDGLELELVSDKSAEDKSINVWKQGPVPTEHAIRGFHSVTLSEEGYERTASVLTEELGFVQTHQDGGSLFQFTQVNRQRLTKLAQWFDQNNIKVNVDRTFSLDEAGQALDYQKDVHPRGKVVITTG